MAAREKTKGKNEQQAAATPTEQTSEQTVPVQEEGHAEDAREQTPETVETPSSAPEKSDDDCAPQETGQPRSGSEAFSAQNASDSECRTGMCDRASSGLENLSVLADRHRVPSWQQAALCRFMGWEDGKMVRDAEYREALNSLKNRRLGGGRMA